MTTDRQTFINLPVYDLDRAMQFFTALGFEFNQEFTDSNAACMVMAPNVFAMLLIEDFFAGFIPGRRIADTSSSTEALIAVSAESRDAVDAMIRNAESAGGKEYREPQDHGWMYGRAFQDPDGHIWEVIYMDEEQLAAMQQDDAS